MTESRSANEGPVARAMNHAYLCRRMMRYSSDQLRGRSNANGNVLRYSHADWVQTRSMPVGFL